MTMMYLIYSLVILFTICICPSLCVSTLNATATNITYTDALLEWDIEYDGIPYDDYQYTLICHLTSQFIELYKCDCPVANITSRHRTNLNSGKAYMSCMFPITTDAEEYIDGVTTDAEEYIDGMKCKKSMDCRSICEDIVKQIKNDEYTFIPNHNGTCAQYMTVYNGWGPQGVAAVIVSAALIMCLIIAQAISFLCPKDNPMMSNSTDPEDNKKKNPLPETVEDTEIYAHIPDRGGEAIITGDLSQEEFNFQGVESSDEFEWMDKNQYQNNGYQGD